MLFRSENSFLYLYPSEFDVHYYAKNGENYYLHQHMACVLTEMQVNYTPNSIFTTFSNGMPTQVNVSLTFLEMLTPTKETIAKPGSRGGL